MGVQTAKINRSSWDCSSLKTHQHSCHEEAQTEQHIVRQPENPGSLKRTILVTCRSTRITPAILFWKHTFTSVIESRWTCVMRRKEERQVCPGSSELKGCLELLHWIHTWCLHMLLFYLCTDAHTLTDIHLWLQPLSAKCQPDKSQGLRVKWNINILTNRAESQESIMLSFPIGDDFISVLPCFSLLSVQGVFSTLKYPWHIFLVNYYYYKMNWSERSNTVSHKGT